MVTLTVRHQREHPLAQVWDAVSAGAAAITGGGSWVSEGQEAFTKRLKKWEVQGLAWEMGHADRAPRGWVSGKRPERRIGFADQYGIKGMVRAVEVTVSRAHGWHVHSHYVVAIDCTPAEAEKRADAVGRVMFDRWERGLARLGMTALRSRGGLDVRVIRGSEASLAEYLSKGAFGSESEAGVRDALAEPVAGMAREAALGALKTAKGSSRHPFELLADVGRHERAGTLESPAGRRDLGLWREWARVSRRRRQLIFDDAFKTIAKAEKERQKAETLAEAQASETVLVIPASQLPALLRSGEAPLTRVLDLVENEGAGAALAWLWSIGVNARLPGPQIEVGPNTLLC